MSQPFGFTVDYHAPFGREAVIAIAEAVRRAVAENWAEQRDRLSDPAPLYPVDPEEWLTQADPERMHGLLGSSEPPLYTDFNCFNYSPLSAKTGGVKLVKRENGTISARFVIAESARYERPEYREELRPESERKPAPPPDAPEPWDEGYDEWERAWNAPYNVDPWPINRRCILHILERLEGALPVKSVSIDDALRD